MVKSVLLGKEQGARLPRPAVTNNTGMVNRVRRSLLRSRTVGGLGREERGEEGREGGGDILIYYLRVGRLYDPFEYVHIKKNMKQYVKT